MVEFIGGNPFYLLSSIRENHCEEILHQIKEEKILIGWSAAAFVFDPSLEFVNRYSPEMNFVELTDLTALKLTEIEVLPHYSKFINKFERFEERCHAYEIEKKRNVLRLNDGDGILIGQDGMTMIRA